MANIKYKEVSKAFEKMASPNQKSRSRSSIGLDTVIGEYHYIDLSNLMQFQNQARKNFDEKQIIELAESVKNFGIRQPLSVIKSKTYSGKYEIISGERRFRAAKLAGLSRVPCIILSDEEPADFIALIENLHRSDLHPIELMEAYKDLLDKEICKSSSEISQMLGVNRTSVVEILSLKQLPITTKNILLDKGIKSRDLYRELLKASPEEHEDIINNYTGKKSVTKKNKGVSSPKTKIINIIYENDDFSIANNRVKDLSDNQKLKLKIIIQDLLLDIENTMSD